mgnify:CR=1 FL=1
MVLLPRLLGIVLVLGMAACSVLSVKPGLPVQERAGVRFTVAMPKAQSVAVSGSFNGWSVTAHPLMRVTADGVWSAVVSIPPGEYVFMYVVNGNEWVRPAQAYDFVDDGVGNTNGVVVVK